MEPGAPLATVPVTFYDAHSGVSALAMQHLRPGGRVVLVYHDAQGVAAARPLLSNVAQSLLGELAPDQTLGIVETSMPEHESEPFVYARVILSCTVWPGRVNAGTGRVLSAADVAAACGIELREVQRTEQLVTAIHQRRSCAFPGFRQLPLGNRAGRVLAVA